MIHDTITRELWHANMKMRTICLFIVVFGSLSGVSLRTRLLDALFKLTCQTSSPILAPGRDPQ